jgi:hypothetical protein
MAVAVAEEIILAKSQVCLAGRVVEDIAEALGRLMDIMGLGLAVKGMMADWD